MLRLHHSCAARTHSLRTKSRRLMSVYLSAASPSSSIKLPNRYPTQLRSTSRLPLLSSLRSGRFSLGGDSFDSRVRSVMLRSESIHVQDRGSGTGLRKSNRILPAQFVTNVRNCRLLCIKLSFKEKSISSAKIRHFNGKWLKLLPGLHWVAWNLSHSCSTPAGIILQ